MIGGDCHLVELLAARLTSTQVLVRGHKDLLHLRKIRTTREQEQGSCWTSNSLPLNNLILHCTKHRIQRKDVTHWCELIGTIQEIDHLLLVSRRTRQHLLDDLFQRGALLISEGTLQILRPTFSG